MTYRDILNVLETFGGLTKLQMKCKQMQVMYPLTGPLS